MQDMTKNKEEMLAKKVWAVVGVTGKKDKFGYTIWKSLKKHGYETYGVSPNYEELEGDKIYKSVKDVPVQVEVVDMVVAPKIAMNVLDEAKEAGVEYIWFQPGSFNDEVISKSIDLGFKILNNDCVYAVLKNK